MIRFLVAWLLAASAMNAHAETFTVTRTDDPVPDGCQPGDCSLREAMEAAEANDPHGGIDTIALPNGSYVLVRGELDAVEQALRVQGGGPGQTRIELPIQGADLFRVRASGQLQLNGLTLVSDGATSVSAYQSASLVLVDVRVEHGPIVVHNNEGVSQIRHSELRDGLYTQSDLRIEDSTLHYLYQSAPPSGTPSTTLRRTLIDGTLSAGTSLIGVHVGTLAIQDSTLSDTTLSFYGAAHVDVRDSTIARSKITIGNTGSTLHLRRVHYIDGSGPIRTEATAHVTIEDSLFEGNTVRALYAAGGADWSVRGSSFVNNRVDGNAGGAILLEDDTTMVIDNSTFSANTFTVEAAGNGARGAAIGFRNGSGAQFLLRHVTLVPPAFMPAGIVGTAIGGHGNGVTLDIANTIVRGTCGMNAGVLRANIGNIESPGNTCGLNALHNLVNASAASLALGALGGNGGRTPTHLPTAGSVAINTANNATCLPTDQRGFRRPGGGRCDVGAVEADSPDVFADGFE